MQETPFTIAAVERDVGLSKDVLRVWERRYGFPAPERDSHGERIYPAEQVRRLRLIKRLMDQGHRPGRLLSQTPEALEEALAAARAASQEPTDAAADGLQEVLDLLAGADGAACLHLLQQRLAREGLRRFVLDSVAPLSARVGTAWERGELQVFEEHLFTELTARTLRQAIAAVPRGGAPRVLLTTLPNEPHGLGLLMVEALLALEGALCVSLGPQTPMQEITRAAEACAADVVALSFSSAFPQRQVPALVQQLRAALPPAVALWAGGAGAAMLKAPPGVLALASLEAAEAAVHAWRAQRIPGPLG